MAERKYLPSLGELIDRLSIDQIKEVLVPEAKQQYADEIKAIMHDIDSILNIGMSPVCSGSTAKFIRAVIVLAQMNLHIWHNEAKYRAEGADGANLGLTHGINGIRVAAKNAINSQLGGPIDRKVDCLAADFKDWEVSW